MLLEGKRAFEEHERRGQGQVQRKSMVKIVARGYTRGHLKSAFIGNKCP